MSKAVIITGASSGLGLVLAKKFVERGDRVWGISRTKRNWPPAFKVLKSDNFVLSQADISSEAQVIRFFKKFLKQAGRLDFLINNAGYGGTVSRVEEISLQEFKKHLSHNLISAFLMSKHALPIFRKQKRGFLIHISSMAGKRAVPNVSAYSVAKFGIVALSQSIAKENLDIPITSIAVCPGGMNTRMRERLFGKVDTEKQQSVDFVADVIMRVADGELSVESGGDIVIRHGKITAVNPVPAA